MTMTTTAAGNLTEKENSREGNGKSEALIGVA